MDELNNSELGSNESIINPELWTHLSITKAIESLSSGDNLEGSFLKFRALVNVAEAIAKGQNKLDENYSSKLEEFYGTEKYKCLKTDAAKGLAETSKKIELIALSIGNNGVITTPMKLGKLEIKTGDSKEVINTGDA